MWLRLLRLMRRRFRGWRVGNAWGRHWNKYLLPFSQRDTVTQVKPLLVFPRFFVFSLRANRAALVPVRRVGGRWVDSGLKCVTGSQVLTEVTFWAGSQLLSVQVIKPDDLMMIFWVMNHKDKVTKLAGKSLVFLGMIRANFNMLLQTGKLQKANDLSIFNTFRKVVQIFFLNRSKYCKSLTWKCFTYCIFLKSIMLFFFAVFVVWSQDHKMFIWQLS